MTNIPKIPFGSILGLNYSGMHDSAIAVVAPSGDPIFAVSLERLSRVKQDGRPPHALLENIPWQRIAKVAVSTESAFQWPKQTESKLLDVQLPLPRTDGLHHAKAFYDFLELIPCEKEFVCHQLAHASSAFWGSGFSQAHCLTYDGGMCNSAWFGGLYQADRENGIQALDQFSALNYAKVTSLYTFVTALLGFTPNKHEGKITGLAAYGQPTSSCRALLKHWFEDVFFEIESVMEWVFAYDGIHPPMLWTNEARIERFRQEAAAFSKEELAATVQEFAENHVLNILDKAKTLGWFGDNICLAGGLFANVKINQRIVEAGFKKLFVAPPMTDDGTALGAAWHVLSRQPGFAPDTLRSMYLGPSEANDAVKEVLAKEEVKFEKLTNPEEKLAKLLASGAVIAVFQGRTEFGPRALGNRSILAQATEADINQKLNARLNRTEFMPFAPVTRVEDAADCYIGIDRVLHAAEFMTVTVNCTPKMQQECPAVVHVDGTARPQIVNKQGNPLLYEVLSRYKKLTGKSALVNTSFNIHEEPIVCSPVDALRGFFESGLDYLYFGGGLLISFVENKDVALRYLQERQGQPSLKSKSLALIARMQSEAIQHAESQLFEKEQVIQAQGGSISDAQLTLTQKDAVLTELQAALVDKERVIQMQSATVTNGQSMLGQKDKALAELQGALVDKERVIQGQSAVLFEAQSSVSQRERELAHAQSARDEIQAANIRKDGLLADTQAILSQKDKALAELQGALVDKERVIQSQGAILFEAQASLSQRERELAQAQSANSELQAAHTRKDGLVADTQAMLAQKDKALAESQGALVDKERVIQSQSAVLFEAQSSVSQRERELAQAQSAREELHTLNTRKDGLLADAQAMLAQKDKALAESQGALVDKERVIQSQSAVLFEAQSSVSQRERELAHAQSARDELQTLNTRKDGLLADTQAMLAQKDKALAETQVALMDKERVIQMQSTLVADVQSSLSQRERELAQARSAYSELQAIQARNDGLLSHTQAMLAQKEKALADFQAALAQKDRAISEWQTTIVKLQAIHAQTEIALHESQLVLAQKDNLLAEAPSVLAERNRIAKELETEVGSLKLTITENAKALADAQTVVATQEQVLGELKAALGTTENALNDAVAQITEHANLIQSQKSELDLAAGLRGELQEKEVVIQEIRGAIDAYRQAHLLLSPRESVTRLVVLIKKKLAPRLGNLNQHKAVSMRRIPPYVTRTPVERLPTISIVTPSYQQGLYIERTMLSILDQAYPKLEYVVQDGGSSDDTVSVLKKYEDRLACWESTADSGQSQAINRGFAKTTGEIMAWLNSDDLLLPGALAYVADYFARHPDVDVIYGNRLLVDEEDKEIGSWILPRHDGEILSWADYVPQETLFWRRSLWDKVGGAIDESFRFAMDWDLLLRFRNAGARFAHTSRFLGAFRIHARQKTSAAISEIGHAEMARIRARELGREVDYKEINSALSPFLRRHTLHHITHRIKRACGAP